MVFRSNPVPTFNLWQVTSGGHSMELLSSASTLSGATYENLELTKDDEGRFFMCESIQVESGSNRTLFSSDVAGEPLQIVFPPMLNVVSHAPFVFTNASLVIDVLFSSRPAPSDDQLFWTIRPAFPGGSGPEIRIQDEETEMFSVSGFQPSGIPDEFVARIVVKNLTESVEVTMVVANDFGDLKHSFIVDFDPPLPATDESVDQRATEAGIALWLIIVVSSSHSQRLLLLWCLGPDPIKKISAYNLTLQWQ